MSDNWENLFTNLKQLEGEWLLSKNKNADLQNAIEKERKETSRVTEALNHTVEHLEGRLGALRQENDLLRGKEEELKEQIKSFSGSLFEVKKALSNAHDQFEHQREQFERQLEKAEAQLFTEKKRSGSIENRLNEAEKLNESLLKDLRKYDIKTKRNHEMEHSISKLVDDKNRLASELDMKNKSLNNETLELSRAKFRIQQLEQDLKKQSMVIEQARRRESAIKKSYLDQKKFNQQLAQATNQPNSPNVSANDQKRAADNSEMRKSLWNKKREIAKIEVLAKDLPSGHPEKRGVIERLHRLKQERAALQRSLSDESDQIKSILNRQRNREITQNSR